MDNVIEVYIFNIECPVCKQRYKSESDMNELKMYSPCRHCEFDGHEESITDYKLEGSVLLDLDSYSIVQHNQVISDDRGTHTVDMVLPSQVRLDYLLLNEEVILNKVDDYDAELTILAENSTVLLKTNNMDFVREYLRTARTYGLE